MKCASRLPQKWSSAAGWGINLADLNRSRFAAAAFRLLKRLLVRGLVESVPYRGTPAGQLWSAQILRENPAEIQAAHEDFYRAGAQVATTASYQVTFDALGDGKGRRQVQGGTRKLHPRAALLKWLTNFLPKLLNNPLR